MGFAWKGFLRRQTSWVALLPSCLWMDAGRSLDSRFFLFLYLVRCFCNIARFVEFMACHIL
jgi:hypothetical protein